MESLDHYFNRDLSWLEFNRRVLMQAIHSGQHPLLERVRFLAIFSNNLDEFFMKRVGYLINVVEQGYERTGIDQNTPKDVLSKIKTQVQELLNLQFQSYQNDILPNLRDSGIFLLSMKEVTSVEDKEFLLQYFKTKVFPVLTPLAVDPSHPFPFLSNLSISVGVKLRHPKAKESLFARIKIPEVLPQWVQLPSVDTNVCRFVRLHELVETFIGELFPEMIIEKIMSFRVTRSVEVDHKDDESDDMVTLVEEGLRLRKMGQVVRFEHLSQMDPWMMELLKSELEIDNEDFYEVQGELNYQVLHQIASLKIPKLRYEPWAPVTPPQIAEEDEDLFKQIAEGDVLLHFPYDSFQNTVERFVRTAVNDPNVLAIKMTLYRAGDNSPLIPLLIKAADSGKQVVCVIEVKARFDEARNIYFADLMEKAGIHVVYGVVGLKTHAKSILVVRKEQDDFKFYAHVGTGNYNPETSKVYTDLGLLTDNPKITHELIEAFNYLTGLSLKKNYNQLNVAPINMRQKIIQKIKHEIELVGKGGEGRIIIKVNSFEDKEICDLLYDASNAGVKIDLIVRGFCCLRPQVKGMSENIRVVSVVGRYLEHSRIYYFQSGAKNPTDGKIYISSADWMQRSFNNRFEIACPIEKKEHKKHIWDFLNVLIADQKQAWVLLEDGTYKKPEKFESTEELGTHSIMMKLMRERGVRN